MTETLTITESLSKSISESALVSLSETLPTASLSETLRTLTSTPTSSKTNTFSLSSSQSLSETIAQEDLRWCDFYLGDTLISCTLLSLLVAAGGLILILCCICCCALFCYKRKKVTKDGSYDEMLLSSDKGSNSTEKQREVAQKPPVPQEVGTKSPEAVGAFTNNYHPVQQPPQQKIPGIVRVYEKGGANEGDYVISSLSVNSLPTWKRTVPTERWVYSSPDGFWRITDTAKDFETGKGFVTSSHPHGGEPPSRSEGWFSANGQPLNINMTPEEYKQTPAKQYHSPFPVSAQPAVTPPVVSPMPVIAPPEEQYQHLSPYQQYAGNKSLTPIQSNNPILPPIIPYEAPKPLSPVDHTTLYNLSNYDNDIYLHDDSDSEEPDGFRRRA